MLDPDTVTFLEGGCALIVGLARPDGTPHATRGWALDVCSTEDRLLRLLLPADDEVATSILSEETRIAVTGCDVRTLRSLQLKGATQPAVPQQPEDPARARRYADAFLADIHRVDGTPVELLERMVPESYVSVAFTVEELFDQTPGPAAGASLGGGSA